MKPSLLLLASTGALLLSACAGKISTAKQPAWVDPPVCQKEMPAITDYTAGEPLGNEGTVVIAVRGDDQNVLAYVANPKEGTVTQVVRIKPTEFITIVDPFGDRIAGGVYMPPPPPPPPFGEDTLKYILGIASRIRQSAPSQCTPMQPGPELGGKVQ